jgi:ABC-2 type transport system permease protein
MPDFQCRKIASRIGLTGPLMNQAVKMMKGLYRVFRDKKAMMVEINPLFLEHMIPAMIIFSILSAALLGIPDPLVTARENGIFRSYKINGVQSLTILLMPALSTIIHLVIVALIITVTAPVLFDAPSPVNWAWYWLVFLSASVAMVGLSVLIGVISQTSRMTVLWSQLVYLPSMMLGGLMISYSLLPDSVQRVSRVLPATQAMNAFNGLAMGGTADFSAWGSVATLIIGGVLGFILAVFLFSWDSRNTTRRGHPLLGLLALIPYLIQALFVI